MHTLFQQLQAALTTPEIGKIFFCNIRLHHKPMQDAPCFAVTSLQFVQRHFFHSILHHAQSINKSCVGAGIAVLHNSSTASIIATRFPLSSIAPLPQTTVSVIFPEKGKACHLFTVDADSTGTTSSCAISIYGFSD